MLKKIPKNPTKQRNDLEITYLLFLFILLDLFYLLNLYMKENTFITFSDPAKR